MKTSEDILTRKMSTYWLSLLLLNGINVYPGRKNKDIVRRITAAYPWIINGFWMFIITSVSMSLLFRATGLQDAIEMLTYITGSSSTLVLFTIGVYKRPALERMLDIIRHEFWHDDRRLSADLLYSRFVHSYGTIMPAANLMMCLTPVIWMSIYREIDSPAALIFRMWMPWTQMTPAIYVAAYATQFVVSLTVLTSITGMVFAMVLIVIEMKVQVDMLMDAIREPDAGHAYGTRRSRAIAIPGHSRRTASYDNLVECVAHHQTLIAYFDNFKSYFNPLFIVDIVYVVVMTCLCVGSVLMTNGFSAFHTKMMSLFTVVVAQFFFYCLIGEQFSRMNKRLSDCIYFNLVQCEDKKLSRIGILFILRTQKPLQLSAMGIKNYSASLFTFASTMKSAYAGLNILYNSTK